MSDSKAKGLHYVGAIRDGGDGYPQFAWVGMVPQGEWVWDAASGHWVALAAPTPPTTTARARGSNGE